MKLTVWFDKKSYWWFRGRPSDIRAAHVYVPARHATSPDNAGASLGFRIVLSVR
jgi:hypothetical protein